jgi:hypothetical protein
MEVVTEGFLHDVVVGGELNDHANSGVAFDDDLIARTDHLHDGRYYTESEIDAFFGGSTTITGYNNDDWDEAYDNIVTDATFVGNAETDNGLLTLVKDNGTDITVNLNNDFRYYTKTNIEDWIEGNSTIAGDTYTPIEYGQNPTSTITGAILIDLD